MNTLSALRKEAAKAPKFVLTAFDSEYGMYVFLHKNTGLTSVKLTSKESEAMRFDEGFDDKIVKERVYTLLTGMEFIAIPANK